MNATTKAKLALVILSLGLSSHAGDITGKITLKGTPPPERIVDLKSHAPLAAKYPNLLTTRHYQVSRDGGLQHVLVYLRDYFDGAPFEPRPGSPVLDHVDGLFQPYVMGIRAGQPLQLKCSDGSVCSFVTFPKVNQAFSSAPIRGPVPRTFAAPEVPVRFKCDLHPWNYAYVGVFAHSFFAVSDEEGRFAIRGVPPGRYVVEIFHPKAGTSTKPVVVTDKTATMDFELPPK
jgi:hypothetical protein